MSCSPALKTKGSFCLPLYFCQNLQKYCDFHMYVSGTLLEGSFEGFLGKNNHVLGRSPISNIKCEKLKISKNNDTFPVVFPAAFLVDSPTVFPMIFQLFCRSLSSKSLYYIIPIDMEQNQTTMHEIKSNVIDINL